MGVDNMCNRWDKNDSMWEKIIEGLRLWGELSKKRSDKG